MPRDCEHRPPCPPSISRWDCVRRSVVERAVLEDVLTRAEAGALLAKYGQPLTPASKVYAGKEPLARWKERA